MKTKSVIRTAFAAPLIALAALVPNPLTPTSKVLAQDADGFQTFLSQLSGQALSRGVSQATINAVMPTLIYNPRVVALDKAQPGGTPGGPSGGPIPKFAPYRARHVDSARVLAGQAKYQELRPLLARVERETGVPESIMVAIWGHETNYGRVKGNYDLAEALATLAYEGRRRQLFTDEFIAVLKMMDRGYPRWKLKGSWAGATGHPQFLPSMYLRLARDGDGDGKADIWDSEADALASIANYFVNAGWRPGQLWGASVQVPENLDRSALGVLTVSPRCAKVHERHSRWKTVAEWRNLGVVPMRSGLRDGDLASFFQPDGPGTPAWLLTGNYRVILDYNCSNFYALSVGLLSDAVGS